MTIKIAQHPMQRGIAVKILKRNAFMRYSSACARNTMYVGPAPHRKKKPSSKRSPASLMREIKYNGLDCLCQKSGLLFPLKEEDA